MKKVGLKKSIYIFLIISYAVLLRRTIYIEYYYSLINIILLIFVLLLLTAIAFITSKSKVFIISMGIYFLAVNIGGIFLSIYKMTLSVRFLIAAAVPMSFIGPISPIVDPLLKLWKIDTILYLPVTSVIIYAILLLSYSAGIKFIKRSG